MKAAYFETPGPPEVIQYGELPTPTPGQGQVLVRVGAAALNPVDLYLRSGLVNMPLPRPFIPGCDLAGTVEAVGPGVKNYRPGDRVWGSNQGLLGRQGTFAEYVCTGEDWLYPTPAGVADPVAAAAALVGITAHLGLFRCAALRPGETVFVNGGTGGVGSMVVQMAKAVRARVMTTVGSPQKAELCRSWGAEHVINYKAEDVFAAVQKLAGEGGIHVWYETQREPDFVRMVPLLARRGRIVIIAGRQAQPVFPVGPFYVKDLALHGFAMFNATPEEQRHCADDINRLLVEKKLQVPIGRTFPLREAAAAHRLLEENTLHKAGTLTGKVVLIP
ncbi:MAG: NADPH:quinone reductase [Gemmataceae bacterium]|nr:NADPH:quinone reductase [Gemmataceae bacterium]